MNPPPSGPPSRSFKSLWQRRDVRWIRLIVGTGLSFLFLWLAFRNVPLAEVLEAFRGARYRFVGLALVLVLVSPFLRAARWRLLFHPHQEGLSLLRLSEVLLVGQMLNILVPTRIGELGRIYLLGQLESRSRPRILGTIALEKTLDILMLFLLALLIPLFVTLPSWFRDARLSFGALAVALFLAALLLSHRQAWIIDVVAHASQLLPAAWQDRVERAFRQALGSLGVLRNLRVNLRLQAWSLAILIDSVLTNYAIFLALDMGLSLAAALFLLAVLQVGVAVPSAPGKLGVFHYLCVLALGVFGVPKEPAIAYAVLLHVVVFVPPSLLGAVFLWWETVRGRSVPSHQDGRA